MGKIATFCQISSFGRTLCAESASYVIRETHDLRVVSLTGFLTTSVGYKWPIEYRSSNRLPVFISFRTAKQSAGTFSASLRQTLGGRARFRSPLPCATLSATESTLTSPGSSTCSADHSLHLPLRRQFVKQNSSIHSIPVTSSANPKVPQRTGATHISGAGAMPGTVSDAGAPPSVSLSCK